MFCTNPLPVQRSHANCRLVQPISQVKIPYTMWTCPMPINTLIVISKVKRRHRVYFCKCMYLYNSENRPSRCRRERVHRWVQHTSIQKPWFGLSYIKTKKCLQFVYTSTNAQLLFRTDNKIAFSIKVQQQVGSNLLWAEGRSGLHQYVTPSV